MSLHTIMRISPATQGLPAESSNMWGIHVETYTGIQYDTTHVVFSQFPKHLFYVTINGYKWVITLSILNPTWFMALVLQHDSTIMMFGGHKMLGRLTSHLQTGPIGKAQVPCGLIPAGIGFDQESIQ